MVVTYPDGRQTVTLAGSIKLALAFLDIFQYAPGGIFHA